MAESGEELKSLLMKVKEEMEKVGLKFCIQKTEIMASSLITSWQMDEEQVKIEIAVRSINNLRYIDDTTLMQESKRN